MMDSLTHGYTHFNWLELLEMGLFILHRSRTWIFSPSLINIVLFKSLGLAYTIFSEIINTGIKGTWEYTELMPIVLIVGIGGMPFLQWLLIPPIIIWLMKMVRANSS